MGEIYHEDSVVATCGTAAGTGNFISSLLALEAEESCARGTDGYIQCSGTFLSSLVSIELETGQAPNHLLLGVMAIIARAHD